MKKAYTKNLNLDHYGYMVMPLPKNQNRDQQLKYFCWIAMPQMCESLKEDYLALPGLIISVIWLV